MRRLLTRALLAATAASAAVVLAASSASAATFNVSGIDPGGRFTLDGTVHLAGLTCQSHGEGTVSEDPSDGLPFATIDSLDFSDCVLGGFINFTVTTNASVSPWGLNFLSESGGVVQGAITGYILMHISGTNIACEVDVVGTTVPGTYTNADAVLSIPGTGQDLTIQNVNGCAGQFSNGEPASFDGGYFIDPPIVITQTG